VKSVSKAHADFVGALGWSTLQAGVKVSGQFAMGKMIALWFGPAGLALIGQFQNILYLQQNLGGGAIQNSLVQALNQKRWGLEGPEALKALMMTGLSLAMWTTLIVAFGFLTLMGLIHGMGLNLNLPLWLLVILAWSLGFSAFWYWAMAYQSGIKNYKALAGLQIQQLAWTVSLFAGFGWIWGTQGACMGLALAQIPAGLVAIQLMHKAGFQVWPIFRGGFLIPISQALKGMREHGLGPLLALSLYSVASSQLSLLIIRTYLMQQHSPAEAGCWEALQRISNVWVPVISVLLGSYYLPTLSRSMERKAYLLNSLKASLSSAGLVAVYAAAVMAFRQPVVALLFSEDFLPLLSMLGLQLGADILKAACWGLHHGLLARRKAKILIFLDLAYQSILLGGLATGLAHDRWESVVWLYAIATLVQLLATVVVWWMDSLKIPEADRLTQNSIS
jgi:PST family polysaccharide transporter